MQLPSFWQRFLTEKAKEWLWFIISISCCHKPLRFQSLTCWAEALLYRRQPTKTSALTIPCPKVLLCDIQFFSDCLTLLLLFHSITCYVSNDYKKIYLTNRHYLYRLLLQHSMEWGTQLPYIKRAHEYRWGVLVMNTNDNYAYKVWACMFQRRKYCTHHSINLFVRDWLILQI